MLGVLNNAYGHPLKPEENAVMPLAGGIMQHGYQCGMLWGAALAAGAQAYRLFGSGSEAETRTIIASQKLVNAFRDCTGEVNCFEITDVDKSSSVIKMIYVFLLKLGFVGCIKLTAKYAKLAFKEINASFSEKNIEPLAQPVSCSALLAQKMGASDLHTVMAAGLAGGIGLCGSACGALGAALWLSLMKNRKDEKCKIEYKDPKALEMIEKFLKFTDYEFECSKIAGCKFENVKDHAKYLRDGGCSKLIETLASF